MLYIGLGNPGEKYHETRHNAGFMVLDGLAQNFSLKFKRPFFKNYLVAKGSYQGERVILLKPLTFMNNSGFVLDSIPARYTCIDDQMIVICDNMDLSAGECRVKTKGSNSGHNGMSSIIKCYGSENFTRIYVGISRPVRGESIISYVLGKPGIDEMQEFEKGIERACHAAVSLLTTPVQRVMNEYNRKNN